MGNIPSPEGFDECISAQIGEARLQELRSGTSPGGQENDIAAVCLMQLDVPPDSLQSNTPGIMPGDSAPPEVEVFTVDSEYGIAPGNITGWFETDQPADIMLAALVLTIPAGAPVQPSQGYCHGWHTPASG
jgi:hypothetical protein